MEQPSLVSRASLQAAQRVLFCANAILERTAAVAEVKGAGLGCCCCRCLCFWQLPGSVPALRACRVRCDTQSFKIRLLCACLPARPARCRSPCSCLLVAAPAAGVWRPHVSSSPPHGVCIHSCVDPFTHAHASDPCLPPVRWWGARKGASVRQACLSGLLAPWGTAHVQPFTAAACLCPGVNHWGGAGHMRGRRHCAGLARHLKTCRECQLLQCSPAAPGR